jgi:hypothetical protein
MKSDRDDLLSLITLISALSSFVAGSTIMFFGFIVGKKGAKVTYR